MTKNEIIKAVTNQIINMLHNDVIRGNGIEEFENWLENGDVFRNNDMNEEDVKECMKLVEEISPSLNMLVYSFLNPYSK